MLYREERERERRRGRHAKRRRQEETTAHDVKREAQAREIITD